MSFHLHKNIHKNNIKKNLEPLSDFSSTTKAKYCKQKLRRKSNFAFNSKDLFILKFSYIISLYLLVGEN